MKKKEVVVGFKEPELERAYRKALKLGIFDKFKKTEEKLKKLEN